MTNKPKILIWDVETAHAIAAIFSLYQDSTPHKNVLKEWWMICAAWKWLGEKKTYAVSVLDDVKRFTKDHTDDLHVIKILHTVLNEADAIVHHYGDKFDIKKFNTRAIFHGLPPIKDLIQVDTHTICKAKFKFMSNRLDYVGNYLGVGGKLHTSPELWLRVLAGNKAAIKEMVGYNKQDVDLLEGVFIKLAPYAPAKLNMNHFYGDDHIQVCPKCGGGEIIMQGTRYTKTNKWQRFQCKECFSWSSAPIKANGEVGKIR